MKETIIDHKKLSRILQNNLIFKKPNEDGIIGRVVEGELIERLRMDESIQLSFNAINMALRLLGEPHPDGWIFSSVDSNREEFFVSLGVHLYGPHNVDTFAPCFIWRFNSHDLLVNYVMVVDSENTLQYPVIRAIIHSKLGLVKDVLDDQETLIACLEHDLHRIGGE